MPYAAKAKIEHEFDTDHLNIWLTFRSPMNQLVKPDLDKWIVYCDGIEKSAATSQWEDTFTMLITVTAIASKPVRVLVKYTGPDIDLRTTWNKQWEPWGAIYSKDVTV